MQQRVLYKKNAFDIKTENKENYNWDKNTWKIDIQQSLGGHIHNGTADELCQPEGRIFFNVY
jgi:hypothetical protein